MLPFFIDCLDGVGVGGGRELYGESRRINRVMQGRSGSAVNTGSP